MTNGEKLKEIFPYLESDDTDLVKVLNIDNLKSWWNAEYIEPSSSGKPNMSETKIDCDNAECNNCVNHKYCDYELNKSEIPTSSITKNNLKVEYVRKQAVDRLVWEYLRKATDENIAFYEHFLDLPTVTSIRPKGHWIEKPHVYGVVFCSECDFELKINNTNYCPNCGIDNNKVTEVRSRKNSIALYRRRECLSCGYMFTTRERYCPDELDDTSRIYKGTRW